MPLYEYQCRACGKTAEVRHGFKETFDAKCEACGGEMARVYSPAGIVFKGSGFYLTDSRSAAEAKSTAAASKTPAATEGSSTPAATTETSSAAATPAPAASTPAAPAATPAPTKSESAA